MKTIQYTLLLALFTLCRSAALAGDEAAPSPAANAAVIYWQAFAAMPVLSKEELALLGTKPGDPLDDVAGEKVAAKFEESLSILARVMPVAACDWGLDLEDGPFMKLPFLAKAQELSKAAILRARLRLESGRPDPAATDLATALRIGRDSGEPRLLICGLVEVSIEHLAIATAAAEFAKFDDASLRTLSAAMVSPSPGQSMKEALSNEKKYFGGWMRKRLAESKAKGETLEQAQWFAKLLASAGPAGTDELKAFGGSLEGFERALDAWDRDYDEVIKMLDLPYAQFEQAQAAFNKRIQDDKANHSLSATTLPIIGSVYAKEARLAAEAAMLDTAIKMRLGGRGKIAESKDPFGDGPFEMTETGGGIELKSKLDADTKPVALTFSGLK